MSDGFDDRVQAALRQRAARIAGADDPLADVHRRARRQRRVRQAGLTVVVVAVLGAGAATVLPQLDQPDVVLAPPSPAASPSPTPSGTPAGFPSETTTCHRRRDGGVAYAVDYPESWWASDGTDAEPCRWFHPEPFDMPSGPADVPGVAIHLRVADTPFGEFRRIDTERDELLSESQTTVSDRRALVQEYVSNADALYPPGTRIYRFLVDVDGRTLSGTTTSASSADYRTSKAVLDAMRTSLQLEVGATFHDDQPACSAAGLSPAPEPQAGLPDVVAETRAEILEKAVVCDYGGLAELAGEEFTDSFGGDGDFVASLEHREDQGQGPKPLRYLVELLHRPYATVQVQGRTQYVWPSAFAYDRWADVPEADRQALEPLYDEDSFANFARFGSYTGYRIGISAEGDWLFFVAGD